MNEAPLARTASTASASTVVPKAAVLTARIAGMSPSDSGWICVWAVSFMKVVAWRAASGHHASKQQRFVNTRRLLRERCIGLGAVRADRHFDPYRSGEPRAEPVLRAGQ